MAPPIAMFCRDRSFIEQQERTSQSALESLALFGVPPYRTEDDYSFDLIRDPSVLPDMPTPLGLIGVSPSYQLPNAPMQVPDTNRLIFDSAKLARLDALLQELKAGGHRVLIYFQMTKMIDLMEEYLVYRCVYIIGLSVVKLDINRCFLYRQYKYLRLDGSSKIEDRRDMVTDWQTK